MVSIAEAADWMAAHEVLVRGTCSGVVCALMALWEMRAPARGLLLPKGLRWGDNIGLVLLDSVLLRLLFPAAGIGMAAFAAGQGWGLLNYWPLPAGLAIIVGVVVLDFVIWLQRIMVHAIPMLWRVHRVHHWAATDYLSCAE